MQSTAVDRTTQYLLRYFECEESEIAPVKVFVNFGAKSNKLRPTNDWLCDQTAKGTCQPYEAGELFGETE